MACDPFHPDTVTALRQVLSGSYTVHLPELGVHVLNRSLPDNAAAAVAVENGDLWIVFDLDKPGAPRHARILLRDMALPLFMGIEDPFKCEELATVLVPEPAAGATTRLSLDGERQGAL